MKRKLLVDGREVEIELGRSEGSDFARLDGKEYRIEILPAPAGEFRCRVEGRPVVLRHGKSDGGHEFAGWGRRFRVDEAKRGPRRRREGSEIGSGSLRAPMPALVVSLETTAGDVVEGGRSLLVLEAMKMETRVAAPPGDWRVKRLLVREGQQVARDQELVELEPIASADGEGKERT